MPHRAEARSGLTTVLRNLVSMQTSDRFVALIAGPPGSGKSVTCKQLAYEYVTEGDNVLYITTERSPAEIVARMKKHGWDVQKYVTKGTLFFADLYSWQVDGDQTYEKTPFGSRLCPLNGAELQMGIQNTLDQIGGTGLRRIIADSLTTFTSLVGEATATRAIRILGSRIRQVGAGVGVITSGVHSDQFQTEMRSFFDLVFETKIELGEKIQRYFRISKYTEGGHPGTWIPFAISDRGIRVESTVKPIAAQ